MRMIKLQILSEGYLRVSGKRNRRQIPWSIHCQELIRFPAHQRVWGDNEETKSNARVPTRRFHKLDFRVLNHFIFLLCYISEMSSPILGWCLASRREVAWEHRPSTTTELMLSVQRIDDQQWSTCESICDYPTNTGMNGEGINEWHFPSRITLVSLDLACHPPHEDIFESQAIRLS